MRRPLKATNEEMEVDELTKHLNHQIVSPLAGLAASLRSWARKLRAEEPLKPKAQQLIDLLTAEEDSILKVFDDIQSFRIRYKSGEKIMIREIMYKLNDEFIKTAETCAVNVRIRVKQ